MLKTLRCKIKGHIFVDSRSLPGMQTCARCRTRVPFEALVAEQQGAKEPPAAPF